MTPAELCLVYDFRDPHALSQAQRHRGYWGRRFVDIDPLDDRHLLFWFCSGGERWHPGEARRKKMQRAATVTDERAPRGASSLGKRHGVIDAASQSKAGRDVPALLSVRGEGVSVEQTM
jgi:hypothetical protein